MRSAGAWPLVSILLDFLRGSPAGPWRTAPLLPWAWSSRSWPWPRSVARRAPRSCPGWSTTGPTTTAGRWSCSSSGTGDARELTTSPGSPSRYVTASAILYIHSELRITASTVISISVFKHLVGHRDRYCFIKVEEHLFAVKGGSDLFPTPSSPPYVAICRFILV